jgi:hypothetical protein
MQRYAMLNRRWGVRRHWATWVTWVTWGNTGHVGGINPRRGCCALTGAWALKKARDMHN